MDICICITESLCCTPQTNNIVNQLYSNKDQKLNLKPINAGEGVEKREPSCTVGGNINWYSHYGEQYGGSLKN